MYQSPTRYSIDHNHRSDQSINSASNDKKRQSDRYKFQQSPHFADKGGRVHNFPEPYLGSVRSRTRKDSGCIHAIVNQPQKEIKLIDSRAPKEKNFPEKARS